jgi:hypothetical protein
MLAIGTLLVTIGLGACGSNTRDAPALVASHPISEASVDHWLAIIDGEPAASRPGGQQSLKRKSVLSFLIFSRWIFGECAADGVHVSDDEAQARLELFGGGQSEAPTGTRLPGEHLLSELLAKARGRDDRLWLMKLAVLTARLEARMLSKVARQVTPEQVAAFYRAHPALYVLPERRDVAWIVTFDGKLLAKAVAEIQGGKSLISVAKRVSLDKPTFKGLERRTPVEKGLAKHVFVAEPHILIGPVTEGVDHFVFEVTRVVPSHRLTLAESEDSIRRRLAKAPASAAFASMLEHKWGRRTICREAGRTEGCAGDLGKASAGTSAARSRAVVPG